MLHNINFCDWRRAQRRVLYRQIIVVTMTTVLVCCFLGWQRWRDSAIVLQQSQQRMTHLERLIEESKQQRVEWEQEKADQISQRHEWQQWQQRIDNGRSPLMAMALVQISLPEDSFLDEMVLDDHHLLLQGMTPNLEASSALLTKLQSDYRVRIANELMINHAIKRQYDHFYPFKVDVYLTASSMNEAQP